MKKLKVFFFLGILVLFFYLTGIGCPIRSLTGISCAGCGMTRAIWAALHFQWNQAFYYHPLFWTMPILCVLYFIGDKLSSTWHNIIIYTCIVSFLLIYCYRLFIDNNEIVTANWSNGWINEVFQFISNHFL